MYKKNLLNQRILVSLSCLAGLASFTGIAQAGTDSGFYIGAGAGSTSVEFSQSGNSFTDDGSAVKAVVGYNFGVIPLVDLGIEGAYVNFASLDNSGIEYDLSSWNGFGIAGLSFGPFGLFAKGGLAAWSSETTVGGVSTKTDSTDPVYGIGARLRLGAFSGRIEYEYYDLESTTDVSMTSASILFHF